MKISAKEIEAMSKKSNEDRYVYFIKRVADNESAWVLDDEGFALSSDDNGNDFIMLWSAKEYAELCAVDTWSNYKAKEIELDYIFDELLPDLLESNINIGVFMVPSTTDTPIVSADKLLTDLQNECEKYS
ncbi:MULTISPECIES: DUF2750 domain-containing protein [Brenneria]|uniref:DUF2750 domain-containing protein n=1 Tax=Brenneria nigrifluens DSM 30175 = ATCC 13028 TaxID=1121120 RepID=A0A2U1U7K9_9GAMM|nr:MULTISPECIES: DUF2750 domain-containing protein [Brenneria]EHD20425.1 hypothetical protein BrE312_0989 [Brenneria sp. EniD312]PWC17635.1 DUF2750 domain-containing protein [Brenneria nigrifluens DSM 30175 = ATCC 13028]QCR03628.1 DUF2750 domain-containing protein [Brenneria nigrifluens DSM 30175 = ATCC 13028]